MPRKLHPRKSDIIRVLTLNKYAIKDHSRWYQGDPIRVKTRQKKRVQANLSFNPRGVQAKSRYYGRFREIHQDWWGIRRLNTKWGSPMIDI